MNDVEKFIKSSWIKRIIEYTDKNKLKCIYTPLLNRYGGNLICACNLNNNDLNQYLASEGTLLSGSTLFLRPVCFEYLTIV